MKWTPPTPEQQTATDPAESNWVGANAGSGKTHVLTQRVARLLLAGVEPEKILCLTYTKAAASEMQTRLFRMLGGWAMADRAELRQILSDLGSGGTAPTAEDLAIARRLFARALETPGGLKIQTIHAFCDAVLRRFPLEAGVSPRFEVLDDRQSAEIVAAVRSEMAQQAEAGEDPAFDRVAKQLNEDSITMLASDIMARGEAFQPPPTADDIARLFGVATRTDADAICRTALAQLDRPRLKGLADLVEQVGGKVEKQLAAAIRAVLAGAQRTPVEMFHLIRDVVLKKDGDPRTGNFPTRAVKDASADAEPFMRDLSAWAYQADQSLKALAAKDRTADLHAFAASLLAGYAAEKASRGVLDFNDLVLRTRGLLRDAEMRSWVLYKLDQGIDHVLVDEAQDTAPAQWDIISDIAEEFLSGEGARRQARSIFVVGDEKQSIYSFQGAEPRAFGRMRAHFETRLGAMQRTLGRPDLITSFRSAPAILDFVDAVFSGDAGEGLTVARDPILHRAHRALDHGMVDLWPLIEPEDPPDTPEWWHPVDAVLPTDTKARLARHVAAHVADLVGSGSLSTRGSRPARAIRPEDILILVRKRDVLAKTIIRALKDLGIPVAGADRLALTREIAVQDLLALMKVAVMPGDDLSLAAVLRSPLGGVSEAALFDLAHGRDGMLLTALYASTAHKPVADMLHDLTGQADFLRPYEFLERVLIRHDGRRRLLARLGPEAEDAIDELLTQALAYETQRTPSLAGFLHWIEAGDIQVKREMDSGAGTVRVMTVHGAKGLEAPIVILPDTTGAVSSGSPRPTLLRTAAPVDPALMLWAGPKPEDDPVLAAARGEAEARETAEHKRLLYVALTRAEDRLILCGARPRGKNPDAGLPGTWYQMLSDGMGRCPDLAALPSPTGAGEVQRFERHRPSAIGPLDPAPPDSTAVTTLPDWIAPAKTETRQRRLAPSMLHPDDAATHGTGIGRVLAQRRGSAVHHLLEHVVPGEPPRLADTAEATLAQSFADLSHADIAAVITDANQVLAMPESPALFGTRNGESLAEVNTAIVDPETGLRMIGRIDRLILTAHAIEIVDFKSDAAPPADPDDIAPGYLAQLGAYAHALAQVYQEHAVRLAILWTARPRLMRVDPARANACYRTALKALSRAS
ncbi:MAG: double-strand break repair helicase AddA [Pseudomonadota bacterium]